MAVLKKKSRILKHCYLRRSALLSRMSVMRDSFSRGLLRYFESLFVKSINKPEVTEKVFLWTRNVRLCPQRIHSCIYTHVYVRSLVFFKVHFVHWVYTERTQTVNDMYSYVHKINLLYTNDTSMYEKCKLIKIEN